MKKARKPDLAGVLGHASGDKRIDILRRIDEVGSISEAARAAGVSYKAAWQALETLGNLAGTPLVDKAVGGSGGGGAVLTAAGRHVLDAAALLARARADALQALARVTRDGDRRGPGLAAAALRTSMRNQFPCVVESLTATQGLVRVGLAWAEGGRLCARITRDSAELLGLEPGSRVLALCKATAVKVAARLDARGSRNLLGGSVKRSSRAAAGGEIALQLPGGISLVGFADAGHGLRVGARAMASVDESAVVIAVTG
jgi:molybdate transport system regulatory protein